ncbi:hypothetical protein [Peribacillus simplex]|uniref:hypothetical protein n=1 Tax=Peribacillus simplex TaxID=1478 RepID=UPI003D7076B6
MINEKVAMILEDKINVIKNGEKSIYLVGPIKLPVNLDGETTLADAAGNSSIDAASRIPLFYREPSF